MLKHIQTYWNRFENSRKYSKMLKIVQIRSNISRNAYIIYSKEFNSVQQYYSVAFTIVFNGFQQH